MDASSSDSAASMAASPYSEAMLEARDRPPPPPLPPPSPIERGEGSRLASCSAPARPSLLRHRFNALGDDGNDEEDAVGREEEGRDEGDIDKEEEELAFFGGAAGVVVVAGASTPSRRITPDRNWSLLRATRRGLWVTCILYRSRCFRREMTSIEKK